jgi:HEAT repeat protein
MVTEAGAKPLTTANQTEQFDLAIKALIKLIKTIGFYPPGHPALQGTLEEALAAFGPLLRPGGTLVCQVRRDHLLLEGVSKPMVTAAAQKLAAFFFARRVQRLLLHGSLSGNDLQGFARVLAMDAAELRRQGGMAAALGELRVTGMAVVEMEAPQLDGAGAEEGRRGGEEGEASAAGKERTAMESPAAPPGDSAQEEEPSGAALAEEGGLSGVANPSEQQDLLELLVEVEREKADERYRFLLSGLLPRLRSSLTAEHATLVIRALVLLATGATDMRAAAARRATSREALNELHSPELFDLLIDELRQRGSRAEQRKTIYRLLTFFGQDPVQRLMERLVAEEQAAERKYLTEAVIHQGKIAVPVLIPYLLDSRWYVVRNAVAVLGEIRDQHSARHLSPLLSHDDLRVRREAVRALTRIGGDQAVAILLQMAASADADLCRQALLSLGALRHRAAIPSLLEMVRRPDPFLRRKEITREAVWALGEIGDPVAVPELITVMQKRQFWNRRDLAEIRAAAALALGEIGGETAARALTDAVQDRHEEVSRAAVQSLRRIKGGR